MTPDWAVATKEYVTTCRCLVLGVTNGGNVENR